MTRIRLLFPLVALAIMLAGCSSKSSMSSVPMPNVSGSWEFVATSTTNPGASTGIDVALKEGQVLVNGVPAENGQISAAGPQINFVGLTPVGNIVFGGNCAPAAENTGNSLSGSISGVGGSMNFTFTENGNVFNVAATLDASGQSIDNGTYSAQSGSGCDDSGSITSGKIVPKLSGIFTGQLTLPDGTSDSVTATVSENSSATLTMNLVSTAPDSTAFSLTGPVTGNYFSVTGDFNVSGQVQSVTYDGYFELTFDSFNGANDIPTLYLVNATTPEPSFAGTLTIPPAQ